MTARETSRPLDPTLVQQAVHAAKPWIGDHGVAPHMLLVPRQPSPLVVHGPPPGTPVDAARALVALHGLLRPAQAILTAPLLLTPNPGPALTDPAATQAIAIVQIDTSADGVTGRSAAAAIHFTATGIEVDPPQPGGQIGGRLAADLADAASWQVWTDEPAALADLTTVGFTVLQ